MSRVLHHPIVRPLDQPVPVVFEGDPADAEDFFFRYCERDDVDEFYVELRHDCPVDECPGPDLSHDGAAIGCGMNRCSGDCPA